MSFDERQKEDEAMKFEKKIALVYYSDRDFGGAERRLTRIYNELSKRFTCDLIVRGCNREEFVKRLERADCKYNNFNEIICFYSNFTCIKHLLNNGYDKVHVFDTSTFNMVIVIIMHFLRRETIFTIASVPIAERIRDGALNFKDKLLIHYSSIVDVLYPWCKDSINSKRKKHNTTITVGTFTDIERFKPQIKKKTLVYAAARLEPLKNPQLLIEACNLSQECLRDTGYKVLLLGKGELEEQLRISISNYCIDDIVYLLGYKKTSEIFPEAEAVFSLQQNENYPSQVIAEACASGCYLFITDVGLSRMCASEEFCSFVKAEAYMLSNSINQFLRLSEYEKKCFVGEARKFALSNYSINNSVKYYEDLLL